MVLAHVKAKAKPLVRHVLDTLYPPRCGACATPVLMHGALCSDCWQAVAFIAPPLCQRCGHPFEYAMGGEALCGACLQHMPHYAQARAVFCYNEASRPLITQLKFSDKQHMLASFGQWLARAGAEFLPHCDAIVPVPLHWWRRWRRRYNQAELLAQAIAHASGLPVHGHLLRRVRHTTPQTGLSRAARERNLQGAFRIAPMQRAAIRGKTFCVVDDVLTTGTTVDMCTRALLRGGAKNVYVLTLAKTVLTQ